MSEWQPIKTAKKYHGNSVLGWVEVSGLMCCQPVFYSEFDRNWRRKLDGRVVETITHWLPYPSPPNPNQPSPEQQGEGK